MYKECIRKKFSMYKEFVRKIFFDHFFWMSGKFFFNLSLTPPPPPPKRGSFRPWSHERSVHEKNSGGLLKTVECWKMHMISSQIYTIHTLSRIYMSESYSGIYIYHYRPGGGIRRNITRSNKAPSPVQGNIITEGNTSPNPSIVGSTNYINYTES
jgi:hypothetical protein